AAVTNVVPPAPAVIRRPEPSLPAGAEVLVEQAQNGFDVTRARQVVAGNRVIDSYRYTAHYLPSHNVVLVGGPAATATPGTTKVLATTATATPTPVPVTPTPAGTSSRPTLSPLAQIGSTPASNAAAAKSSPQSTV